VFSTINAGSGAREAFRINNVKKGLSENVFNEQNQTSREDWIHFTLASRNSDSDFVPDLSAAGLHIKILGATPLHRKPKRE
jgi:hypothetical protein